MLACDDVTFVLLFVVRAVSEMQFSYLLKADDDCFVDIVRVLQRLSEVTDDSRRVWLGRSAHDVIGSTNIDYCYIRPSVL